MPVKITQAKINSLKPPETGRLEICDSERVGLRFRLTPTGSATWLYQKQIKGGVRRGFTLGSHPAMTLSAARSAALQIQVEAEQGLDRILLEARSKEVAQAEALSARSAEDILSIYIANHIDRNLKIGGSRDDRKRQLETSLKPLFRKRMDKLSRADIQRIVDTKLAEGRVTMANRLRAAICAFTHWAYARGHSIEDAGSSVQKAGKESARHRTPSIDEVREIWAASFEMGELWGPFLRLAILTGQRNRSEVLAMKWAWVDWEKCQYEIPTPKNGLPHVVHLTSEAILELRAIKIRQAEVENGLLPQGRGPTSSPFVFSTNGRNPSSGVSHMRKDLDQIIAKKREELDFGPMEPWVLHDLRRSIATSLAEAGVDEGVIDRMLNHKATASRPSVVSSVYNKATMLPERARAYVAWAKLVTAG